MQLGVNLPPGPDGPALAEVADDLGFAVAWAAEAYGADAASVLAFAAARTRRIDLGSAVFQIPGRTPANCAMTAASLDVLSGGRFRLGLGVSGPQVSEGWHGVRFDAPLARTREYRDVVRLALRREPVRYDGAHHVLPLPDGPGKALRLSLPPVREHLPMYLAAIGPRNVELAGELFDGWLAVFSPPDLLREQLERVAVGRATAGSSLEGFDVVASVPLVVGDDPRACADAVRPLAALYLGGMGSREQNFYNQLAGRSGHGEAAARVQDLYLAGEREQAAAAVPYELLDATSLLGPRERIAERMAELAAAGVTTLALSPLAATREERTAALRTAVSALERSGAGT